MAKTKTETYSLEVNPDSTKITGNFSGELDISMGYEEEEAEEAKDVGKK